jgi:hypothetical protein
MDMDPHHALYTIAREFPDGIEGLAKLMNMSAGVLRQKLSPQVKTHHVTAGEFSEILHLCKEAGVKDALLPLSSLNWRHGLVSYPTPLAADLSDEQLTLTICRVMKEVGDVGACIGEALQDKKITLQEMDQIEREFQEALAALGQLRARTLDKFKAGAPINLGDA